MPRYVEVLTIDKTLTELERLNARQAKIVQHKFFLGMSISEVAESLNLSEASVERDWRVAKAWLTVALGRDAGA